jgi:hypothetical protein
MSTTLKKNKAGQTAEPIEVPPVSSPSTAPPEFLRLPPPGHLCAHTGLSRSYINTLVLPTEANGRKPPVKSFCLRQPGARTGVRLVSYQSLRDFILSHPETGVEKEVAE